MRKRDKLLKNNLKTLQKLISSDDQPFITQACAELKNYVPFFYADLYHEDDLSALPSFVKKNKEFKNYRIYARILRQLALDIWQNKKFKEALETFHQFLFDTSDTRLARQNRLICSILKSINSSFVVANLLKSLFVSLREGGNHFKLYNMLADNFIIPVDESEEDDDDDDDKTALIVGSFLYNFLCSFLSFLKVERIVKKSKKNEFYSTFKTSISVAWLKKHAADREWIRLLLNNLNILFTETETPMFCKPIDWVHGNSNNFSGGYIFNEFIKVGWLKEGTQHLFDNKNILTSINRAQSVPYRINNQMLHILNLNKEMLSSKEMSVLTNLSKLRNKTFYYQYQVDFRGRLYPINYTLHPIGGMIAKALVEFAEGTPITNIDILKRFTAALFIKIKRGYTNTSLLKEFENRTKLITKTSLTKENVQALMERHERKWYLIRLIIEWQLLSSDSNHASKLPIYYDCTASAFQGFELLIGPYGYSTSLNLIEQDETDTRNDFYTTAICNFFEDTFPYLEERFDVQELLRKALKSSTISTIYGLSEYAFRQNIKKQDLTELDNLVYMGRNELTDTLSQFYYFIHSIPPFQYFSLLRVLVSRVLAPIWRTEFTLAPLYLLQEEKTINLKIYTPVWWSERGKVVGWLLFERQQTSRPARFDKKQLEIRPEKTQNSICANLLQSIDATILHHLINNFAGDVIPIHDCFGIRTSQYEPFFNALKQAFILIQSKNYKMGKDIFYNHMDTRELHLAEPYYTYFKNFYKNNFKKDPEFEQRIRGSLHLASPTC